jgi:hypothetical protein
MNYITVMELIKDIAALLVTDTHYPLKLDAKVRIATGPKIRDDLAILSIYCDKAGNLCIDVEQQDEGE